MSDHDWFDQFFGHTADMSGAWHDLLSQLDPEVLHELLRSVDGHHLLEVLQAAGIDPSHLTDAEVHEIVGGLASNSATDMLAVPNAQHELHFGSGQGGLNVPRQHPTEGLELPSEEGQIAAEVLERSGLHPVKTVTTEHGVVAIPAGQYYHQKTSKQNNS